MRTDAQIASLLLAFTLPIHRYEWCIDPLLGVLFVGMGPILSIVACAIFMIGVFVLIVRGSAKTTD
jgi:hypothetical protein